MLISPIGTTVAQAMWRPGQVQMQQGSRLETFTTLDALSQAMVGSPLPVAALFSWLQGQQAHAPGWTVDLSELADGRMNAKRLAPEPVTEVRILLDTMNP